MLRRIKEYVSTSTLMKVYNAIILSHFDYCSLVWDECADYLLKNCRNYKTERNYEIIMTEFFRVLLANSLVSWWITKEANEMKVLNVVLMLLCIRTMLVVTGLVTCEPMYR